MIVISDPARCCGCSACASICGKKAITMQPDALGFLYPKVDTQKCVDCGLCEKVCAFSNHYDTSSNLYEPKVYAVRHRKMGEIAKSRSGAMFAALSDWVLEHGGVVYGAGYVNHFRVAHKRAVTREQRDEFRGSKYVQSDMGGIFLDVADDLRNGLTVLFTGTPCQTSGLISFLKLKRISLNSLYVADIVCHGVPGPFIWRDYLAYVERKYGDTVLGVSFRDKKEFGWEAHKESFTFKGGKKCKSAYTYMFYQHIMFRHSCGQCHFTNLRRPSDITLADFWGWQNLDKNFNADDKGVSLVLLNTGKGLHLFENVKSQLDVREADTKVCLQPNLLHPSEIHPLRQTFEEDYTKHGFLYVARKYGDMGWRYRVKLLKRKCRTAIRLILKR